MTNRIRQIGIYFYCALGTTSILAAPVSENRHERTNGRFFQVQIGSIEQGNKSNEPPMQRPIEARRGKESGLPDSSGSGSAQTDHTVSTSPDHSKRQGRMTPEERRALRRQIDEAGHDIYTFKR